MTPSPPPDWKLVRLGDIGDALIGLTYDPSSVRRSGTLVLRSSNVQHGILALDDNVYVDCAIPERIRIRANDILICVRNGSRRLIGKSTMPDDRVVGETFGAFMAVFRSDANPYLRHFFQSDAFKRQIDEHLGATINQITNGSLNGFSVFLPEAPERAAISERLDDADELMNRLERLIAKKDAIKLGMVQQLLTGSTRLSGFGGAWSERPLGSLIDGLRAGTSVNSVPVPGPLRVLKTSCVSAGRFDPSECKTIAETDVSRARTSPRADSLIISRMNTPALVGEVGYVGADHPDLFLPDRLWLAATHPHSSVNMRWLAYTLSSRYYGQRIRELATGTSGSMKNISKPGLLGMPVAVPPPLEQRALADA